VSGVRRAAIHAIPRCPRGQDGVADGRFIKGARAAAGKREGPAGTTMGHAARPWAFSEAAGRVWRTHPAGQTSLARRETHHGHGHA
jgi:hypothetical protein